MPSAYLDRLGHITAFRCCSQRDQRDLRELARLIDHVSLPAGLPIAASAREMLVTVAPTELVIARRALPRVTELAPEPASAAWLVSG